MKQARPARSAPRLPSLNAVRAFEAVGRLLSYSRAASELHVTPSAISHQIKALEDHFGTPLLRMTGRQLFLTGAGEKYFRQISQALTQLTLASSSLMQSKDARVLRITMAPTIAMWWFLPRLDRFLAAFPEISVEVSANTVVTDFALGHYDVAIRYTRRMQSGLHATPISKNEAFPVCSPLLMEGSFPLRAPSDLPRYTLISTRDEASIDEAIGNWPGWLEASGYPDIRGARQIHLTPRGVMLAAAVQGLGIGIARTILVADAMRARQLVCPFGPALPLPGNYYFICPEITARDPDIAAFRDWILAEAKASAALVRTPK